MLRTATQVAEVLGVHRTTVSKVIRESRDELGTHIHSGKRRAKLIDEQGVKVIAKILNVSVGSKLHMRAHEPTQDKTHIKLYEQRIESLERELKMTQDNLSQEREERRKLQEALLEAQHRHDTIVMTSLKSLERRLPPPQDMAPEKPQEDKKSLWVRFCDWLNDSPDYLKAPQPV